MRRPTTMWPLVGVLTLVLSTLSFGLGSSAAYAAPPAPAAVDLGPNVKVFDPSMPTAEIQKAVDAV